ncbi:regulator of nonsense transcripts 3A [Aspergillus lentulus]|uniref:putative nonsense-mediated mRNA decay protein Upf3 n=1 Tax=Aspergillus lentulus TaxID=293939 RepID=UPI00139415AD|nr:regulator of nonsense transcripts 3A [Aspergillus lentulus]GFF24495.1 regulator of nonsense transcripts 3A [Aspergillus lentulus]GFF54870.1 regulator of nonsense transcripts 3A [Aspergillus lentulus]
MTQISDGKSTGGVLQIPAAATQKNTSTASRKAPKPPAPRLKLLVRRLPPGLTQSEFENALGSEWMVGAGKVDWYQYKPGKVSKDHAKPSRPSRAYIHVTSSEHIAPLSDKVRQTSFLDARNTFNDPVLLGPPSLEFAPYAKIPGTRVRKDARQGTIDQDPEFIAFLESLTQPITKPATVETPTDAEEKKDTVTTTPLVQYIKEKKANKAKEASSKSSRHAKGEKESKSEKVQAKKLLQRPDKDVALAATGDKAEKKSRTSDKATKEAVKAANRAASAAAKQAGKPAATQNTSKDSPQAAPTERKRERNNVAAAAKILQRDLGLAPSGGRRRAGKGASTETDSSKKEPDAAATAETGKKDIKSGKPASPSQQGTPRSKANATPPSGESASSRAHSGPNSAPTSTPSAPKQSKSAKSKPAAPIASPTATQAFLKHANPSQGVTEPLLETAFAPFGEILKVEIDKKKGFGYIDFAEPEGLQKAIAASPVTVAQSQVVVLERKVNPGAEKTRGKGRSEQPAPINGSNGNGNRGAKQGSDGGSGPGTPSSSRGPRGGRGSRNKGGSKSNGANASSNTPSGKTGGETK